MTVTSSYIATRSLEETVPEARAEDKRWQRAYLAMFAVYIIVGIAVRLLGWWYGDAIWFVNASRHVLDGSWDLYSLRMAPEIAPPLGITYSYSPLLAILISPFVAFNYALNLGDDWAFRLMGIPLVIIDVLAMQQLRDLVRARRPGVDERLLFLGIALSLFVTSFFFVTAYRGHIEGLVLLGAILSLRLLPRNLLLSGLCAGLALAAKHTTAVLMLLPVGLVLLTAGRDTEEVSPARGRAAWLGRLRDTVVWAVVALLVFAAFMIPPLLRNAEAVRYAMLTLPRNLVVLGPGLPRWAVNLLRNTQDPASEQTINRLIHNANTLLVIALLVVMVGLVALAWLRKRPVTLGDTRMFGLLALGGVMFIVLSKWVSDHYYQLPLTLVFIWDIVRTTPLTRSAQLTRGSFPWIGFGAIIAFEAIKQITPASYPEVAKFSIPWLQDMLYLILFVSLLLLLVGWFVSATRNAEVRDAP